MSRKAEVRARMQVLQKEFAELNAEMKEIDSIEKSAQLRERYKEYTTKVFLYGPTTTEEPKFEDVTDEDRETAYVGENSTLVWTGNFNEGAWLLLRSKEEFPRARRLLNMLDAARSLMDKNSKDKEAYVKTLLGE